MSKTLDVSIVIACYNEEALLEASVADIVATMDASRYEYELIFIDDASSDRTVEIIKKICAGKSNYRYVCHAENVGRGGTVVEGIRLAKGRVAGFLDVDLEVPSKHIPELAAAIIDGSCSVATVSRSYRLSLRPLALLRTVLSSGYRRLVNLTLHLPYVDTETGYKFFDRRRILPVLDECQNVGWFWDTEIMALAAKHNLTVKEMPGFYERRIDKTSSVRVVGDTLVYAKDLLAFGRRLKTAGPGAEETAANAIRVSLADTLEAASEFLELSAERLNHRLNSLGSRLVWLLENNITPLAVLLVLFTSAFLIYHAAIISSTLYNPVERVMAYGLLICEIFFAINGLGYVFWISKSRHYRSTYDQFFSQHSSSSVACLMPVCDEPLETISETLASICAMRHANKQIYVLDDSSRAENIKNVANLARDFGVTLIRRNNRLHYKAGNLNNALKQINADYVAVFDADQRPSVDFLWDIVPLLDENPRLALVQTRQDYENSYSLIAHAAALQNALFYEYIAESKDVTGSMFCCGTNCVLRTEALNEVGGFDTETLTEDFATSLKVHVRGWETRFHDKLYVMGMGPETLGEYLKQYSRWATGTLQVLKAALKTLVTKPRALTPAQWFEYWLSCSYYLTGLVNFYLLLLPAAYMLFGVDLIKGDPIVYLALFSMVFVSFWSFFLFTSIKRGYPVRQLIIVCARLETCKFAVYSKAFFAAILGLKLSFKVTKKGDSDQLNWRYLVVPLTVLSLNVLSALIGLHRLGGHFHSYVAVNTFWAAYNVWQLSAIIQYNSGSAVQSIQYLTPFNLAEGVPASAAAGELKAGL